MLSLSVFNQADAVEAFNSTSINPYFEQLVSQIYPIELQLNKANHTDTEALLFGLRLIHYKWNSFHQKI